jgi:hypothetical protein
MKILKSSYNRIACLNIGLNRAIRMWKQKSLKLGQEDRYSMIIGLRVSLRKRDKDSVYWIPYIRLLFF